MFRTSASAGVAPLLISFSGLDGSGKSTQIENVHDCLCAAGYHVRLLAFWDDVVVLSGYREGFVHKVHKSEIGVGAPGKPVHRRDKNVRKWYLTLARHSLYLLDALHLGRVLAKTRRSGCDVVIMDRYIYDEWANLPLRSPLTRAYVRLVHGLVPRPELAYLLDADPAAAHARKPEYSVDFLWQCRTVYYRLAKLLGNLVIIPPLGLAEAKQAVEAALMLRLSRDPDLAEPGIQPASTRAAS